MSSPGSVSSHWCKGVLDEIQVANPAAALSTPAHGHYPVTAQTPLANTTAARPNDSTAEYYKQYYEYYQRYYQQQQMQQQIQQPSAYPYLNSAHQASYYQPPPASTAAPPPSLPPPAQTTSTYASAVIHGQQGWRAPPSAPIYHSTGIPVAQQPKKPNPSRWNSGPPAALNPPTSHVMAVTRATPVSKEPSSASNSPWPPSLKAFVERAFSRCETDEDRVFCERKLKALITSVTNDGRLHKHRWDLEPTPVPPSALPSPVTAAPQSSYTSTTSHVPAKASNKRKKSRFDTAPAEHSPAGGGSKGSIYGPGASDVSTAELATRQQRANRFMKEQERHKPIASIVSGGTKGKKRQRVAPLPAATTTTTLTEFDLEQLIVVGTCQKVEKDYLRLTSAPDPSTVRPLEVLRRSLELAKNKWATNKDAPECYVYMCSQLKSLRQDLMVQHIRTDVYEFHARVALESSDLNEYNQCQTQLKQMYTSGLPGSEMEFTAYRILYYLYLQGNKKYQQGSQDLAHLMAALPQAAFEHPAVKHALAMRESMLLENYHRFFRLYRDTPNLGNCILDMMLDSWRVKALQRIIRAYKPVIAVEFVAQELSFDSIEECVEFVIPLGIVTTELAAEDVSNGELAFDTKNSVVNIVAQDDKLLL